jgi:hypothetical protein
MFIPDPDFIHSGSRIQQQHQKRRRNKDLKKTLLGHPGSGKIYPGSRGQKGTRSRIRIRNTGFSQVYLYGPLMVSVLIRLLLEVPAAKMIPLRLKFTPSGVSTLTRSQTIPGCLCGIALGSRSEAPVWHKTFV